MMSTKRPWKFVLPALMLAGALGLAGCGGSDNGTQDNQTTSSDGSKTDGPTLAVFAGSQTPIVANFNPYSPTALSGTLGSIYEPLFYYNKAKPEDPKPLLGKTFTWNDEGTELTVQIRDGVKWNDGTDFTVEDVVYSFTNDAVGLDNVVNVEAVGPDTIKLTFSTANFTNEYAILGTTYIVPEHIFAEQTDLVSFANSENPVGTGPFMSPTVTEASYTVVKNPNYWDPERPKIKDVQFIGVDSASSAESMFVAGQLDYSTMFSPEPNNITGTNRYGYLKLQSPNPIVILACSNPDLGCDGAQTDVAVRQAFSKALDRKTINERAYYGHATIATPTFTLPGRDDHWIKDGIDKRLPDGADVDGAKKILEDAGYTLGSDGIYVKDGQRASFDLLSVDGWADANAAGELMVAMAKEAGIEVKNSTVTLDQYTDLRQVGNYDMIISALFGTAISDPYTIYRNSFTSAYTTPVGTALEPKQTNFARYSNPEVDQAIADAATTNDESKKKELYGIVQDNIVRDLPYIPMFHGASQTFYNNVDFDG
ncbi:ABC transporter substrate-binding protein [Arcanobacterium haemolyticum]|nr:ABC transporter substrate-binding protein [Arcanobacterium haemolyticum]